MGILKQIFFYGIIALIIFLFPQSCMKKEEEKSLVKVFKVSGAAEVLRKDERIQLQKEFYIINEDIIRTGNGAHVSILVGNNRIIYLNENTKGKIEYIQDEDYSGLSLNVSLEYGETFTEFISSENVSAAYAVSTPVASIVGKKSCFNVKYYGKKEIAIVKVFEELATIFPANQNSVDIAECNKILIKSDGNVSRFVSLTNKDIDELKKWVDEDKVECIVDVSRCIGEKEEKKDLPPVWKGKPKKQCKPNVAFADEVSAQDPEGTEVQYYLLKGPSGMSISVKDGAIQYKPKKPGTFEIQISAEDEAGNSSILQYYLTVIGRLNAVLQIPETVKATEEFIIDASRSVNSKGRREGLLYRFDINSDGSWDYPASGEFGKKSSQRFSYKNPGEYTIKVQIRDQEKNIASGSRSITVTVPPEIQISYSPLHGTVGVEYTLAVKQRKKKGKPMEKLVVRWDLNGDGRWDYPGDGSFTDELEIQHLWDKAGVHKVTVEAEDASKNRIVVSEDIKVYKGVTIEKLKGPDTVNINENVAVTCIAKDPDFALVEYAWDFAGVGMFSEKSKKPTVNFSYKEAGKYTLVCCVTNDKGMSDSESRDIIVLNFTTTIDAGGPYKANVNVPFTVEGLARDVDNKIASYFWDFDNDRKFEWHSEKTAKAKHTFSKQGTYVIRFGAKLDDGTVVEDTATVVIANRPPKAFAGEDIVSRKGKKVKLSGIGKDPDGNIVKYEWALEGDGNFWYSNEDTGFIERPFAKYTSAILKVTDSEGAYATDTVNIIICSKGMKLIEQGNYCIDIYEWPNMKEAKPVRQVTYQDAAAACKKAGKRLCTAKELETACKGDKKNFNYPYGRRYEPENCNTYGNKHIDNQVATSGEFPECVSRYGVFDMSGNVAEWTSTGDGTFNYVVGGWWQNGEKRAQCGSYVPLKKSNKFIYVGFRCCK